MTMILKMTMLLKTKKLTKIKHLAPQLLTTILKKKFMMFEI